MRMSLIRTSAFSLASDASAASRLCTKRALKPSAVKTSHNNSQVTESSSTTIKLGASGDTSEHLLNFCANLGKWQRQSKARAMIVGTDYFDFAAMTDRDL